MSDRDSARFADFAAREAVRLNTPEMPRFAGCRAEITLSAASEAASIASAAVSKSVAGAISPGGQFPTNGACRG